MRIFLLSLVIGSVAFGKGGVPTLNFLAPYKTLPGQDNRENEDYGCLEASSSGKPCRLCVFYADGEVENKKTAERSVEEISKNWHENYLFNQPKKLGAPTVLDIPAITYDGMVYHHKVCRDLTFGPGKKIPMELWIAPRKSLSERGAWDCMAAITHGSFCQLCVPYEQAQTRADADNKAAAITSAWQKDYPRLGPAKIMARAYLEIPALTFEREIFTRKTCQFVSFPEANKRK